MQAVITHLKDFIQLVVALGIGYLVNGWPFFIAHLYVAYLIRNSWKELNREKEALKDWHVTTTKQTNLNGELSLFPAEPVSGSAGSTSWTSKSALTFEVAEKRETIVVLEQFVEESRILGGKGFFVPMTDFSDRLDSAVEGKIAELHDRTNLFLFVGIAGTMFGVFEFAFRSYTLMLSGVAQSEKIIKLGEYLSGSMSKAFPVGFFGLLFTFIAQIMATTPEQRLRGELSEATRKALETRETATFSQAELLQGAAASIALAMRPLKDLKDTLSESLKPVVEVFGRRLDTSLGLLEAQFKRLEQTSGGLEAAVIDVRQAVGSIAEATKSLDSLIKETPKVIEGLIRLEQQHEQSLGKVNTLFDEHFTRSGQLNDGLQVAVTSLAALSDKVVQETAAGISRIESASVSGWTTAAESLRLKVAADLESLFGEASARTSAIAQAVENALHTMNALGAAAAASTVAIGQIAPDVADGYKDSLTTLGKDSIALWGKMIEDLGGKTQPQYLAFLDTVQKGTTESKHALTKAAEEWSAIARDSKGILKEPVEAAVAKAKEDLVDLLRTLDTNVEDRIKEFSKGLQVLQGSNAELVKSTAGLVDKVSAINAGLSNWAAEAGPVAKEIRGVTNSLKDQGQSQADLIKRLNATAEKLGKIASRSAAQPRTPTASGGTDEEPNVIVMGAPTRNRRWWKPHTWWRR